MESTENIQQQQWLEAWKHAGIALHTIKQHELQEYIYTDHLAAIDEMLQWAVEHAQPRVSSGLIEQQQWFMKLRAQQQLMDDVNV